MSKIEVLAVLEVEKALSSVSKILKDRSFRLVQKMKSDGAGKGLLQLTAEDPDFADAWMRLQKLGHFRGKLEDILAVLNGGSPFKNDFEVMELKAACLEMESLNLIDEDLKTFINDRIEEVGR